MDHRPQPAHDNGHDPRRSRPVGAPGRRPTRPRLAHGCERLGWADPSRVCPPSHQEPVQITLLQKPDKGRNRERKVNTVTDAAAYPQMRARQRWVDVQTQVGTVPMLKHVISERGEEYPVGAVPSWESTPGRFWKSLAMHPTRSRACKRGNRVAALGVGSSAAGGADCMSGECRTRFAQRASKAAHTQEVVKRHRRLNT
jgi:hypothetical protein